MTSVQTAFLSDPTVHETLENGLSVIFLPIQHSNVLALQLWVKTGSIHEGNFLGSGVSHFVEHMVFKGTETRNYEKIFKNMQQPAFVFDGRNLLDLKHLRTIGFEAYGIGKPRVA